MAGAGEIVQLAHAGHWLVNVLYFAPVVAFLAWLGITTRRERKAMREEDGDPEDR